MDVLSEVLKVVKLSGALYYNAEFSAPWRFRSPHSRVFAPYFSPAGGHVIIYHLLMEGHCTAGIESGERIELNAGDVIIFPHGDPHSIGNGRGAKVVDTERQLQQILEQGLKLAHGGGGGEVTRLVCGYLVCDPQLGEALLSGLPPVFKVHIRNDEKGRWLEESILFSVGGAATGEAGLGAVLSKLSEVLFTETLRRYISQLPSENTGWLAGARDPAIGKALALLHQRPAEPWTIATLAHEVGISRSVLAARFRHFLGEPPMAYLTRWRLQLGATLLKSSSRSVAEIAGEVGYESEPAFNRAFKRQFNVPPARFRNESRVGEKAIHQNSA